MFAVVLPFYNLAGGCRLQCLLQFFRDLAFFKAVGGVLAAALHCSGLARGWSVPFLLQLLEQRLGVPFSHAVLRCSSVV